MLITEISMHMPVFIIMLCYIIYYKVYYNIASYIYIYICVCVLVYTLLCIHKQYKGNKKPILVYVIYASAFKIQLSSLTPTTHAGCDVLPRITLSLTLSLSIYRGIPHPLSLYI